MRRPRDELIRALGEELTPVRPRAPAARTAALWLALALAAVGLATLASGPLRPGLGAELRADPGLDVEVALALAASALAALAVMRLRVPGLGAGWRTAWPALALALGWAALLGVERLALDAPVSTLGARPLCWAQVLLLSIPPLAAALWFARHAAPLERAWTGLLGGLAAGSLAALAMQLGCMHEPLHGLAFHLAPALGVAAAGAGLGRLVLRPV